MATNIPIIRLIMQYRRNCRSRWRDASGFRSRHLSSISSITDHMPSMTATSPRIRQKSSKNENAKINAPDEMSPKANRTQILRSSVSLSVNMFMINANVSQPRPVTQDQNRRRHQLSSACRAGEIVSSHFFPTLSKSRAARNLQKILEVLCLSSEHRL
jgi:hypothetical protein